MLCELIFNLKFVSAFLGFISAILLYKFGLPANINRQGNVYLILENTDEKEALKAKRYDLISRIAMYLLMASFLLQIVDIIIES